MSKIIKIFLFSSLLVCYDLLAQPQPRKYTTNKEVLNKIAEKKVTELSKDVIITPVQRKKIKGFYYREAFMIDSMKYLPPDYFTYPEEARERIMNIKRYTEEKIKSALSEDQWATLEKNREIKRQRAIQKLNEQSLKKKADRK